MNGFTAADVPALRGRCFVVTGANTGIGFEASRLLAARGARVLLACRDAAKANAAIQRIIAEVPGADLAFVPLDQADLASVRAAAQQIMAEPRLDVLINNAGVMIPPLQRTAQDFELQFGVNHLATFALTGLLLPKLAETAGSRVVITSSLAHKNGSIDWDDLNAEQSYQKGPRYFVSKLANMLHLFELDRRLRAAGSPVMALGCHPGVATTELDRHSLLARVLYRALRPILNTPEKGAWPTLQAATDQNARAGDYFGPQRFGEASGPSGIAKRSAAASDPVLSRRLWDVSVEMTGIDPGLAPAD
jgi:NAD(P)-dependent dehydrogenase (short-subunit alcohol dehydrogenase family)